MLGAESRALLIGVPQVSDLPEIATLEGPENDVASLRRTLIDNWGFREDRIQILGGSDATRAAILGALDRLTGETTSGDHVLVYFSGHGVSAHDPATRGYGMRPDTGAIVPADLKRGTPAETFASLLIGSRDLRPRFERLEDAGAETLVLFDACYSGDSAKSPPRLVARSAEALLPGHGSGAGVRRGVRPRSSPPQRRLRSGRTSESSISRHPPATNSPGTSPPAGLAGSVRRSTAWHTAPLPTGCCSACGAMPTGTATDGSCIPSYRNIWSGA